jgi:hypothetical protein
MLITFDNNKQAKTAKSIRFVRRLCLFGKRYTPQVLQCAPYKVKYEVLQIPTN